MNRVNPTDSTLSTQRNEGLIKNAQKQMAYDGRLPPQQQDTPAPTVDGKVNPASDSMNQNQTGSTNARQMDDVARCRVDAVVFVICLAQIMGYLSIAFEIYVFSLDQYFNKVLNGEKALREISDHNAFRDKTYNLRGHEYLQKAKEYAIRDEPLEIVFIVFIILFIIITTIHLFACYVKAEDFEKFSSFLIGLYSFGGALCIISSIFLIAALTNIENNYSYAADMLHNFQHVFDTNSTTVPPNPNTCPTGEFVAGCETYEYARKQVRDLEIVFRLCGDGSRYTRYFKSEKRAQESVVIQGETYYRSDLKSLGFCTRDGFKIGAAIFAVIMGILCSIVPVVYCCESKSASRDSYKINSEDPMAVNKSIRTENLKKTRPKMDEDAVVEQFKAYILRDSDPSESSRSTSRSVRS